MVLFRILLYYIYLYSVAVYGTGYNTYYEQDSILYYFIREIKHVFKLHHITEDSNIIFAYFENQGTIVEIRRNIKRYIIITQTR